MYPHARYSGQCWADALARMWINVWFPGSLEGDSPVRIASPLDLARWSDSSEGVPVSTIADSADVDAGAQIGAGSKVWHLAQIREAARLGENCVIGRGAYIGPGVVLGENCKSRITRWFTSPQSWRPESLLARRRCLPMTSFPAP